MRKISKVLSEFQRENLSTFNRLFCHLWNRFEHNSQSANGILFKNKRWLIQNSQNFTKNHAIIAKTFLLLFFVHIRFGANIVHTLKHRTYHSQTYDIKQQWMLNVQCSRKTFFFQSHIYAPRVKRNKFLLSERSFNAVLVPCSLFLRILFAKCKARQKKVLKLQYIFVEKEKTNSKSIAAERFCKELKVNCW